MEMEVEAQKSFLTHHAQFPIDLFRFGPIYMSQQCIATAIRAKLKEQSLAKLVEHHQSKNKK